MKTQEDAALVAFRSWDNHLKDCKATITDGPKDGGPTARVVAHPCVYDGDKCQNGMKLYNNWRRAIGQPVVETRMVEES